MALDSTAARSLPAAGKAAAQAAGSTLRDEFDRCLDELRSVSEDRLPEVRKRLDALLAEAGKAGRAGVDSMRASSARLASAVGHDLHDTRDMAQHYVEKHPWKALAVAGVVGFIGSLLLLRR